MPATEPLQAGPYPEPSDPPDGPNQLAALAVWAAGRLVMRFASPAARDAAITSPVEGMEAFTGSGVTGVKWLYLSGTWRNVTVPGAWTAYTPSWTNLTLGNGAVVARYSQIGKTVTATVNLTIGSTTSVGEIFVPALPVADVGAQGVGSVWVFDSSATAWYPGVWAKGYFVFAAGRAAAAVPFAWATGDLLFASVTYEAA